MTHNFTINTESFYIAHELFKHAMLQHTPGEHFVNFQHSYFVASEIEYKKEIIKKSQGCLSLGKWDEWLINGNGKILTVLKEVCGPSISKNLLVHRYGGKASAPPLYKESGVHRINSLERQFYNFFLGGPNDPKELGRRFDALADYLRSEHLGAPWAFMAYLVFLADPSRYFPIRAGYFDNLLKFYGIKKTISGYVNWENYSLLLDIADQLRELLEIYGWATALEIQSYMWIVSSMLVEKIIITPPNAPVFDFDMELKNRKRRAQERERVGLLGEELVFDLEKEKLIMAQRNDLANQVRLISTEGDDYSFDILSYELEGTEIHIEVKTTSFEFHDDHGFFISQVEKEKAEQDPYWRIYRVWLGNMPPIVRNIGNIFRDPNSEWRFVNSSWFVEKATSNQGQ